MKRNQSLKTYSWRLYFIVSLLICLCVGLIWRIIQLGVIKHDFLLNEGANRSIRVLEVPAFRGKILDRNGEVLAISVPVDSIWINPKSFSASQAQIDALANSLKVKSSLISDKIKSNSNREFVYLKRRASLIESSLVKDLKIPGVFFQQEYQRYYPDIEIMGQIIGFTNIDDKGQEGLELAYDNWLRGEFGKIKVLKDRLGNVIRQLSVVKEAKPGNDLVLSIDRRIQYLTFQELKNAVMKYNAETGTAVVLSVKTGEVLAMLSYPSCDPNNRSVISANCLKNKAVTDLLEPGSTTKVFTIANALLSGKYDESTLVDTNPGALKIEKHIIYDDAHKNNGVLSVTGVLQKSSDIGVAKITASLPPNSLLNVLRSVGFGASTLSGFPGEASGVLPSNLTNRPLVTATVSFGYGISVTALQLARAYAVLANNGLLMPISFLKLVESPKSEQVLVSSVANKILNMLRSVVEFGGTGRKASIQGYQVAGKTGTARIAKAGGYYTDRHWASFAGIAPASRPELVVVVVIKDPKGLYHGGSVAAPIFANIMHGALRVMNILPDAEQNIDLNALKAESDELKQKIH